MFDPLNAEKYIAIPYNIKCSQSMEKTFLIGKV